MIESQVKNWLKNFVGMNEIQISDVNLDLLLEGHDDEFNKIQIDFSKTGNLKKFLEKNRTGFRKL